MSGISSKHPNRLAVVVTMVVALSALSGCGAFARQQQAAQAEATKDLKQCGGTITVKSEDGNSHERPLTVPELVNLGNQYRDVGLKQQGSGRIGGGDGPLSTASDCYGRALKLAPDNYAGTFGLGVTYLARAKNIKRREDKERAALLTASKRMLGRAYALRHGHLEALYHLAEVSVIDDNFGQARSYLELLRKHEAKPGPVAALMGYMAEAEGNDAQAKVHYEEAIAAGWPFETLVWVSQKLRRMR